MTEVGTVRSTFFGTSSIYLTDDEHGIFIDGFLSRPSLLRIGFGRISPNQNVIARSLERGNVTTLDAVFTAHSHFDHAMDSAEVIALRGGALFGSESTLNIGRGAGLAERLLHVIGDGDEFRFGDFAVRVFEGIHSPGNRYPGAIDEPLRAPAKADAFKEGGCFSFLITHPTGSMFIHPSANFVPDKFLGVHAEVLYLGVGALGAQDVRFQEDYWRHVVEPIGPKVILPVHWDNFGRPLTKPLRPLPRFLDKFTRTEQFLERKIVSSEATLKWQDAFETITPFEG